MFIYIYIYKYIYVYLYPYPFWLKLCFSQDGLRLFFLYFAVAGFTSRALRRLRRSWGILAAIYSFIGVSAGFSTGMVGTGWRLRSASSIASRRTRRAKNGFLFYQPDRAHVVPQQVHTSSTKYSCIPLSSCTPRSSCWADTADSEDEAIPVPFSWESRAGVVDVEHCKNNGTHLETHTIPPGCDQNPENIEAHGSIPMQGRPSGAVAAASVSALEDRASSCSALGCLQVQVENLCTTIATIQSAIESLAKRCDTMEFWMFGSWHTSPCSLPAVVSGPLQGSGVEFDCNFDYNHISPYVGHSYSEVTGPQAAAEVDTSCYFSFVDGGGFTLYSMEGPNVKDEVLSSLCMCPNRPDDSSSEGPEASIIMADSSLGEAPVSGPIEAIDAAAVSTAVLEPSFSQGDSADTDSCISRSFNTVESDSCKSSDVSLVALSGLFAPYFEICAEILGEVIGEVVATQACEAITEALGVAVSGSAVESSPTIVGTVVSRITLCLDELIQTSVEPDEGPHDERRQENKNPDFAVNENQDFGVNQNQDLDVNTTACREPRAQPQESCSVIANPYFALCCSVSDVVGNSDPYWQELVSLLTPDVGEHMIKCLHKRSRFFQEDREWAPFNSLSLANELRECSPVHHIQWIMDNSAALTEADSHYDTEDEIYSYVEKLVNYEELVLHERQRRFSIMHKNFTIEDSLTINPIKTYAAAVASLFQCDFNDVD